MTSQKRTSIYTQLANKYNIPYQVIASNDDTKSIMFGYLFKIKLKKKYASKERQEPKSNI